MEKDWKHLNVYLSDKADSLIRDRMRRKGDLTKLFHEAAENTNWDLLEIPKRRKTFQTFHQTSIAMTDTFHKKLKDYAKKNKIEVSALIDAIIIFYFSP
jgi:hypothetical protein